MHRFFPMEEFILLPQVPRGQERPASVAVVTAPARGRPLADSLRTKKSFQDEWIAHLAHFGECCGILLEGEPGVAATGDRRRRSRLAMNRHIMALRNRTSGDSLMKA
jgi:hypothetical protein